MFSVVEKFISINGEGAHAGELAAFIRFQGCNLKCSFCDTKWANSSLTETQFFTAEELTNWVCDKNVDNVTLTGGEPLLQENIYELIALLTEKGKRVEIETNGSVALEEYAALKNRPVFTMDYKLKSSNMEQFMQKDNFSLLKESDTVKFVSGSKQDLESALEIIERYSLISKCHVYFSPVFGKLEPSEIVDFMINNNLNGVRLQLQMHKFIWEPNRRGV